MANEAEVMDALALMAANLAKYYGSESPVCVPIKRAAAVLKLGAARHDLDELLIAAAMTAGKNFQGLSLGDSPYCPFPSKRPGLFKKGRAFLRWFDAVQP